MGITEQGVDFLRSARDSGVSFRRTITLGRQLLLVAPERLAEILSAAPALLADHDGYAEQFFKYLGASETCSVDISNFEGATHVHDLNTPLPSELSRKFSAVIDGGCLEHIFDFPTAMRNCMEMVELGGHLICISPVNNAPGHGFYQFSPELFFRVLSSENGFEIERILLAEVHPGAMWYRVADPASVGERIEFRTENQAYLYVQARRNSVAPIFAAPPVQSDYRLEWGGQASRESSSDPASVVSKSTDKEGSRRMRTSVETFAALARRQKLIRGAVRGLRWALARPRRHRHTLDSGYFQPLGPHLSKSDKS